MRISVSGVGKSFPVLSAVVVSFQMWLRRDLAVRSWRGGAWLNVISCNPDSAAV